MTPSWCSAASGPIQIDDVIDRALAWAPTWCSRQLRGGDALALLLYFSFLHKCRTCRSFSLYSSLRLCLFSGRRTFLRYANFFCVFSSFKFFITESWATLITVVLLLIFVSLWLLYQVRAAIEKGKKSKGTAQTARSTGRAPGSSSHSMHATHTMPWWTTEEKCRVTMVWTETSTTQMRGI